MTRFLDDSTKRWKGGWDFGGSFDGHPICAYGTHHRAFPTISPFRRSLNVDFTAGSSHCRNFRTPTWNVAYIESHKPLQIPRLICSIGVCFPFKVSTIYAASQNANETTMKQQPFGHTQPAPRRSTILTKYFHMYAEKYVIAKVKILPPYPPNHPMPTRHRHRCHRHPDTIRAWIRSTVRYLLAYYYPVPLPRSFQRSCPP